jgi:hypothetical protein
MLPVNSPLPSLIDYLISPKKSMVPRFADRAKWMFQWMFQVAVSWVEQIVSSLR